MPVQVIPLYIIHWCTKQTLIRHPHTNPHSRPLFPNSFRYRLCYLQCKFAPLLQRPSIIIRSIVADILKKLVNQGSARMDFYPIKTRFVYCVGRGGGIKLNVFLNLVLGERPRVRGTTRDRDTRSGSKWIISSMSESPQLQEDE